jgi:argininosuccinate synthase
MCTELIARAYAEGPAKQGLILHPRYIGGGRFMIIPSDIATQYAFAGYASLFPLLAAALFWRGSTRWGALASTLWTAAAVIASNGIATVANIIAFLFVVFGIKWFARIQKVVMVFGIGGCTILLAAISYYALKPDVKVIAPWREWDLTSRTRLIQFAEEHQIPIAKDKRGEAPFSVDDNLLHSSSEGKILEEPWDAADEMVWQRTISPMDAPDRATEITIEFERGDAVGINGERLSPATLLTRLNALGKENGIGRLDLVENRFVGMKSRGCYETPGGTILYVAHRAMESITLDREAAHLKDSLMPRYAEIIYNGFWFSPERRMLQALIDESQASVTGTVRLKLYKGNTIVTGRQSPHSLYSMKHVTFEDDQGAYDQFDAQGFIKLNALRLRLGAMAGRKGGAL